MIIKFYKQDTSVETYFEKNEKNNKVSTYFTFSPSVGKHYFVYKKHLIMAERTREMTVDRITGSPVETLVRFKIF